MLLSPLLLLASRQPHSEQSHPGRFSALAWSPRGDQADLRPARTPAGPQSSLQGRLGGPEPPRSLLVFQHRPLGVEEGAERGLGLSGVGFPLDTANVTREHTHSQIYTHVHTRTHPVHANQHLWALTPRSGLTRVSLTGLLQSKFHRHLLPSGGPRGRQGYYYLGGCCCYGRP